MALTNRNHGTYKPKPWHLQTLTMALTNPNHGIYEPYHGHGTYKP